MLMIMKKKKLSVYEILTIIWFVYVLIVCITMAPLYLELKFQLKFPEFITKIDEPLMSLFFTSYMYTPFFYILLCFFNPHDKPFKTRYIILNIIDSILCFCVAVVYPWPYSMVLYDDYKFIYYFLGIIFAIFPFISDYIIKKNIDVKHVLTFVSRVLMIFIVVMFCFMLESCVSIFK